MASSENGRLSASELSRAALTTVEELTGYEPEAVTGLEWDGEFWRVTVAALEMSRIPSTTAENCARFFSVISPSLNIFTE